MSHEEFNEHHPEKAGFAKLDLEMVEREKRKIYEKIKPYRW